MQCSVVERYCKPPLTLSVDPHGNEDVASILHWLATSRTPRPLGRDPVHHRVIRSARRATTSRASRHWTIYYLYHGLASPEATFVQQDRPRRAISHADIALASGKATRQQHSPAAALQPLYTCIRDHSANVFALLARFLRVRQAAFDILRK